MRLAKATANLIAVLALAICLVPVTRAQDKPLQKTTTQAKAKKAKAKKPAAKAAAEAPAGTAPAPATDAAAPAEKVEPVASKRDPFLPLVNTKKDGSGGPHLPGKAGLVISTVRVDGTVRMSTGMIAVVTNPDQRVYFIREGDRLYDGEVEKIGLDGVTFRENSKDAFGKAVERSVTKRIYPSAGEQQ
jgi:Tfp pilus assembly protein PilP